MGYVCLDSVDSYGALAVCHQTGHRTDLDLFSLQREKWVKISQMRVSWNKVG